MTLATVSCRGQLGLSAPLVQVEVSLDPGLPAFNIVGLPATVVRESKERVRAALLNSRFEFPAGRITVNLSPADLPKRGGRFDLPIALGILLASRQVRPHSERQARSGPERHLQPCSERSQQSDSLGQVRALREDAQPPGITEYYGELGLSGELKPVRGMLLAAAYAARDGHKIIVPEANAEEVSVLLRGASTLTAHAATDLRSVCAHLNGTGRLTLLTAPLAGVPRVVSHSTLDLSDVRGQLQAKRALTVAAGGGHSLLMVGPPGAGKSMLARRLPTLLPPLTEAEALEVAAIASVSGSGFNPDTFGCRPVRIPHHTTSAVALVGGGPRARPGEISLAHHGVLFLDELLEFDRRALEALREPLESGAVSVSRAALQARYPAEFQLVAAMNPCPCGRLGDPSGNCICTPAEVIRYRARVSAPLLDRLDIHIEVPRVDLSDFEEGPRTEDSAAGAVRVLRARQVQVARQGTCNARLTDAQVDHLCAPDAAGRAVLERAIKLFGFSARARQRILRLARTIADLQGVAEVSELHISEAVTYRSLDRRAV